MGFNGLLSQRRFVAEDRFSILTRASVWSKGTIIQGWDAAVWRYDAYGAVMKYDKYGVCGEHGWEIDHILPQARGGSDDLSNLQPLFWENNRAKGDTYPWYGRR